VFVGSQQFCAVYHVNPPSTPNCYDQAQGVGYTIGWVDPPVQGNKHDYFLLRDPDPGSPGDNGNICFFQNITDKLLRNYTVGELVDPGLGGRACCTSEYVVAHQRVRPPVVKK
jgi:hypothetical protein